MARRSATWRTAASCSFRAGCQASWCTSQPVEERRDFARGEVLSVVRAAADRVEAPCPYYAEGCGGCSWQHAEYAAAAAAEAAASSSTNCGVSVTSPTMPTQLVHPAARHARPVALPQPGPLQRRPPLWRAVLHLSRSTHRLLRIDHCWIVHPRIKPRSRSLQGRLADVGRHIHQVSIRVGANTGQLLVSPALPEVPEVESGQPYLRRRAARPTVSAAAAVVLPGQHPPRAAPAADADSTRRVCPCPTTG